VKQQSLTQRLWFTTADGASYTLYQKFHADDELGSDLGSGMSGSETGEAALRCKDVWMGGLSELEDSDLPKVRASR
jgi:hypothetical protein